MQVVFDNRQIATLYETRQNRKLKLPQPVITKFIMRIQQLEAAIDIHDLWKTATLNFKKLERYPNRYSVRIDIKWRLEMEIDWQDKEKTMGIIHIIKISKHYGD